MRLHRLELTAFGPFAGTERVDFDELSAAGLFLLHGPTGAGKTSVLDGVCYALYGQVPGARPVNRLRSDHAAAGTVTQVVLELTLGGRRLEITRRPEQVRAKKRGTGTTVERAVTLLRERIGGQWRGVSKSHQEIGEEVRQLVGMSREQFCQVVLLPQGEFATFLRASAADRAALLGRLFDTRRFKEVEHWLRDRRHDAERRLAVGDDALRQLAARMRQAAGDTGAGAGAGAGAEAETEVETGLGGGLLAEAAVLRCDARERHAIARSAVRLAEQSYRAAAEEAQDARELAALQQRHRDALARVSDHESRRPAREAARERLDRGRRALAVDPALSLHEKAAAGRAEALAAERAALARLAAAGEPPIQEGESSPARADVDATAADSACVGPHSRPETGRTANGPGPARGHGAESAPGHASVPARSGAPDTDTGGTPTDATRPRGGASTAGPSTGARPDAQPPLLSPVRRPSADMADEPARSGTVVAPRTGAPAARPPAGAAARQVDEPSQGRAAVGGPAPADPDTAGAGMLSGADAATVGGGAPLEVGVLARRVGELREELGSLAGAGEAEARLAQIRRRREELEREERADEGAVRDARAWLESWPAQRAALRERAETAAEAAARAASLEGELREARSRRDAAAERDRLAQESVAAQDAAREARDRAAQAREEWQDAREARIAGMAAELAAGLVDGAPCRVCGAEEHPFPARPGAGPHITPADEEAANAAYERLRSVYERAAEAAARVRAAHEAATAAAGTAPCSELVAAYEKAAAEHTHVAQVAAGLTQARRDLARAEEEHERRTAQRETALSRGAARESLREELDGQRQRLTDELAAARAGHPTVEARRSHLSSRITLLEQAAHAVRERVDGERRLAETAAALDRAASAAGFASPAEAARALLPPAELARAEAQAAAWAREEAAIEAEVAAPEPAAAAALPPADPDGAQRLARAAQQRLQDAAATESAAATRIRELDRISATMAERVRELGPERQEFTRVKRLSELASGTSAANRFRMELETYVLAARLEQVAAAAGVRLQRMSAGRYTLAHSDARAGNRAKSGLGLMVVDAWTGTERDTATLSGGETFFASLALALGLADVVTDEAGGMRLDTLFIDEGFGSLDEQTLDEVLDVLDGLRERDRAVGIVSHVADLRHRIPVQLKVAKDRGGSTVRLTTAAV